MGCEVIALKFCPVVASYFKRYLTQLDNFFRNCDCETHTEPREINRQRSEGVVIGREKERQMESLREAES